MDKLVKTNDPIKVEMVTPEGKKPRRTYGYEIEKISSLGKEIKISPKSHMTINKPGYKSEYFVETVNVVIGIGKDHTADLVMSKDSWEALLKGEKVHITTAEEFNKLYVYRKSKKK